MALVDPNLLPKYNRDNPNWRAFATCIVYDAAPSSVVFLKSSGIKTLKDLEGRSLAISEGDATWPLFQVLCKINNVDVSKIKTQNMTGQLRDSMVVQRRVDASLGFYCHRRYQHRRGRCAARRDQLPAVQQERSGALLAKLGLPKGLRPSQPQPRSAALCAALSGVQRPCWQIRKLPSTLCFQGRFAQARY